MDEQACEEKQGTHPSSASRANFASGIDDMLIISPPNERYMLLSARVENWGPSMTMSVFFG